MPRFARLLSLLVCLVSLSLSATAQLAVSITSPRGSTTLPGLSTTVQLTTAGVSDLSRLIVKVNGLSVSARLAAAAQCTGTTCTASASLSAADGLRPGPNHIGAALSTAAGAIATDNVNFRIETGLTASSSPASALPSAIRVVSTPTGFTFDHFPGFSGPVTYPGDLLSLGARACGPNQVSIFGLDPATLQPATGGSGNWAKCVSSSGGEAYLAATRTYAPGTLVFANTGFVVPGTIDNTAIGGSFFNTYNPYLHNYAVIGSAAAANGSALDTYTYSDDVEPLDGVLELVTTLNGPATYVFRHADAPSFTITPGVAANRTTATITVGYHAVNFGSAPTPNYTVPPAQQNPAFQTYTIARQLATNDGGFAVVLLDRHTLAPIDNQYFATNVGADLPASMAAQSSLVTELTTTAASNHALVLLTTVGNALDSSRAQTLLPQLGTAVQALGASAYDLAALPFAPSNTFSFVGTLDNLPITTQTYATSLHTQQAETGVLHGFLERNTHNFFSPTQVVPVVQPDANGYTAAAQATTDILHQVGLSRPVPWPLLDTPAHIAAYQALSLSVYRQATGESGATCSSDPSACDVRINYANPQFLPYLQDFVASPPPYPSSSAPSFTPADFQAVETQLAEEMRDVNAVQIYFSTILSSQFAVSGISVATSLTTAATQFSADLNAALGTSTPPVTTADGAIQLTSDGLNSASALFGVLAVVPSPVEPVFAALSASAWLGSAVAQEWQDYSTYSGNTQDSDPYVTQLGTLLSATSGQASAAATSYMVALQNGLISTANRAEGDWYKLQTLGTLTRFNTPDSTGFYFAQTPEITTGYIDSITLTARRTFMLQLLPQFFSLESAPAIIVGPTQWTAPVIDNPFFGRCSVFTQINNQYVNYIELYPTVGLSDYSWAAYPSLNQTVTNHFTWDYFLARPTYPNNNYINVWTTSFGDQLMGPANPAAPAQTRNLNLPQTWFYSSNVLPQILSCAGQTFNTGLPGAAMPLQRTITTITGALQPSGDTPLTLTVNGIGTTTPTGSVTLTAGTTTLATVPVTTATSANTVTATYTIPASAQPFTASQITASYTGDSTYAASQSTPFTVPVPTGGFALATPSISIVQAAGPYSLQNVGITPVGGFIGTVQLSCTAVAQSGSPAATCTPSASSILLDGTTAQTLGLTITPAASASSGTSRLFAVGGAGSVLALLLFVTPVPAARRRRLTRLLLAVLSLGSVALLNGCGSSSNPQRSYQVSVRATYGATTQSSSFVLTVH